MKSIFKKTFGIIAFAVIIVFSMTGCPNPSGGISGEPLRSVSITNLNSYNGRQMVRVGLYPDNNLDSTPSIGALSGTITGNTLNTDLFNFSGGFNENVPWKGSGEYYVVLRIPPPDSNPSVRGIVDSTVEHIYITRSKVTFNEATPDQTLNFSTDFEIVPPREITISGVSAHAGQTAYITLYPDSSITSGTEVSFTEGTTFYGDSFKKELKMNTSHGPGPWYGSGSFYVKLEFKSDGSTTAIYTSNSAVSFSNATYNPSVALSAFTDPNAGMDGLTEETAFKVYNKETLERIGSETGSGKWTRSAYYKLTDDITLTGYWTPIGTYNRPFTGTFDGGGYSISDLAVNAPSALNQGLFGYINPAGVVKNLNLVNVNNIAEESVGSVAGLSYGTLQNISVTGRVEGTRSEWDVTVGGIVGQNLGLVENCSFSGEVVGTSTAVGGIVGLLNGGTVRYCYAEGSVSGVNNVGGVAGRTTGAAAAVEYCVALNTSITRTGSGTGFGRVIGYHHNISTETGNYARSSLAINISPEEPAGIQGTNITSWNPTWFESIGFTDPWWTGKLPTGP